MNISFRNAFTRNVQHAVLTTVPDEEDIELKPFFEDLAFACPFNAFCGCSLPISIAQPLLAAPFAVGAAAAGACPLLLLVPLVVGAAAAPFEDPLHAVLLTVSMPRRLLRRLRDLHENR